VQSGGRFPRAAIATPQYLASAVGLAAFARGGNAVDAVVAANLALGVVAPYLCGYGGDLFAIVWDGRAHGYLGSGRSAASGSLDALRSRHATEHMPVFGADTVTVPGAIAGWFDLLERFGTRALGELAHDAVALARDGFEVTEGGAIPFRQARQMYRDCSSWQGVYGDVDAGTVLRQPALARTIETLATDGPDSYYRGPIGAAIAATVEAEGGTLGEDDLAHHTGEWVEPLRARYRDTEIAEPHHPPRASPRWRRCASSTGSRSRPPGPRVRISSSKRSSRRSRTGTDG